MADLTHSAASPASLSPTQGAPSSATASPSSATASSSPKVGSQGASGSASFTAPLGLTFDRHFTRPDVHPFDEVKWELRDAVIQDFKGKLIFEQKNVEVPADWSMTATNIVASKYLHGQVGTPAREKGVRDLISRVAESIRDWGIRDGYFASPEDAEIFFAELTHLLVHQKAAFNSPVWFNVGCDRLEPDSDAQNWHWDPAAGENRSQVQGKVAFSRTGYSRPQCSACFINSVQDSLDSILTLAKTEGMLFKWGSGAGSNLSSIRGSMETLSGGGTASGPLSFMRGFDAFAGVIKSGGKTRRAAKMVILNVDHPDIEDFIQCKVVEERKAWTLMSAGYDGSGPDSEAFTSIFFQNANNSVRVTDEFMHAVENDLTFSTRTVKDKAPVKEYRARDLMHALAEATWQCGDPGMQYDTTINRWHTSKNTARINASNPCSEYMFLDDSACNLASFNLMKFLTPSGKFDVASYRHAIGIVTTAMEIIVDAAGYPTEQIAKNSHDYRPLGLGYANLGALLMDFGLPYDSDAGRAFAATLTAILCGDAYAQSARIASDCPPLGAATPLTQRNGVEGGACPGFYVNREPFLDVIRMHRAEVNNIDKNLKTTGAPGAPSSPAASSPAKVGAMDAAGFVAPQMAELKQAAQNAWDEALVLGEQFGFRNSQVTVLAPTGTIGFMMDCDTTGIEPDLALVKYKKLVGGGMIKIVNNTVPGALFKLGYTDAEVQAIVNFIDATGTIEGAPSLKPEHLAVFDCSFKPSKGTRTISWQGHVKMMAAAQPFLSGAISKTVNLPNDCTAEDIAAAYTEAWRLGLKAVAIYRDGSKGTQPLNVSMVDNKKAEVRKLEENLAVTTDLVGADGIKSLIEVKRKEIQQLLRLEAARHLRANQGIHKAAADFRILRASSLSEKLTQLITALLEAQGEDPAFVQAAMADMYDGYVELVESGATSEAQRAGLERQLSELLHAATENAESLNAQGPPRAVRHRLPSERASITHKFAIAGHEGYVTVGLYPNGCPGEIFIRMAKEGSTISGLMDSFATAVSMCLQHGVPLKLLCEKFAHTRFEPSGWTGNPDIGFAKSIMDYLFRWMQLRFLSGQQLDLFAGLQPGGAAAAKATGALLPTLNAALSTGTPSIGSAAVNPTAAHSTNSSAVNPSTAPSTSAVILSGARSAQPKDPDTSSPAPTASPFSTTMAPTTATAAPSTNSSAVNPTTAPNTSTVILSGARSAQPKDPDTSSPAPTSSPFSTTIAPTTPLSNETDTPHGDARDSHEAWEGRDRSAPQQGIATDLTARSGLASDSSSKPDAFTPDPLASVEDRGLYHAATAMRSMYDMGDAPSCSTCGAIMTRNGSCYRCMECGSTSGCS